MVKDYTHQEYEVIERIMSNGRKRYTVYVVNLDGAKRIVTESGYCALTHTSDTISYQKHEVDGIIAKHKRTGFQNWLRDVSQIGVKSVSHADPRGAS